MRYDTTKGFFLSIHPDEIERIEYIQGEQPTEGIQSAYNRLGCDVIINGSFYTMATGEPCAEVVDEGEYISTGMSPYGFGFVEKKEPVFCCQNSIGAIDFISGYPCLLKDNEVYIDTTEWGFSATSISERGRTAIGTTSDGTFIIRAISDVDSENSICIKDLALYLQSEGCTNAINLDGGGSSQWITPWGSYNSYRSIDGFIAIWLKTEILDESEDTDDDTTIVEFEVGDTVMFSGGDIYSSSLATSATRTVENESICSITAKVETATHPYHCISQDGGGVYGWVDEAMLKEYLPEEEIEEKEEEEINNSWKKAELLGLTEGLDENSLITGEELFRILDQLDLLE